MALAVEDLGRKVFRSAAERVRPRNVIVDALFAQSKIGQADVTAGVEQHVLGLEIAVDDVQPVDVLKRERDLGGVEASARLRKLAELALRRVERFARRVLARR